MPDEPTAEKNEEMARAMLRSMLSGATTKREKDLLEKALADFPNRSQYMDEYFYGGRHHDIDDEPLEQDDEEDADQEPEHEEH